MFYNDIFIKSLKINLLQVAFYHNSNHHQLINLISPHTNLIFLIFISWLAK